MTKFFNRSEALRSLVGAIAAVLIGGTFLAAAAGPAFAAQNSVNFAANSNIVASA